MPPPAIAHYHAHIYYDPASSRDCAELLRARVAENFPQARLGRWHDELVGPHPQSMFQIAFPAEMLAAFVPWLMLNRDGLDRTVASGDRRRSGRSHRPCRLVRRRLAVAAQGLRGKQIKSCGDCACRLSRLAEGRYFACGNHAGGKSMRKTLAAFAFAAGLGAIACQSAAALLGNRRCRRATGPICRTPRQGCRHQVLS